MKHAAVVAEDNRGRVRRRQPMSGERGMAACEWMPGRSNPGLHAPQALEVALEWLRPPAESARTLGERFPAKLGLPLL
jgi:hypothetical protein